MYYHTSSAFTSISSRDARRADLPGRQLRSAHPGLLLSGLLALFGLAACGGVDDDTPSGSLVIPDIEWQLVFEDEFDGDSLDTSKWNIDTGDGCPDLCGWGNNEKQVYSEDNITVSGGVLTIQGRQEADGTYTSARINSKGKFDFQYGKVEVKARLPAGQGTWPAIWMLHSDPTIYGPWPLSGEIDIMEAFNLGVDGNTAIRSSTHYGLPTQPPEGTTAAYGPAGFSPDMNSYVYTLEWERDKIRFYVDGEHWQSQKGSEWYVYYPAADAGLFETDLYDEYSPYQLGGRDSPFDQLFHLVINLAIGGNPVGDPDPNVFPQNLEVDYVRVYECANANPDTGRGCGTADPGVVPLSDNDGNVLEKETTAQPYREELPLFTDGPETLSITVGDQTATNTLQVGGFTGDGATVINDPAFVDPDEPENIVWHVAVSGGVGNAYLESEDKSDDPLLETGFNFSGNRRGDVGGYPVGEVAFDMRVNSIEEGTDLIFKLQSAYPNLGQVVLPPSELVIGEWRSYSVKFDMFLANPFPEGSGVDLANVLFPFVIEVQNGSADVYLDNIRATNACQVVGACGADLKATLPDVIVYDDAVNTAVWTRGIVASDSGTGYTDYTDPDNPANKVNWREIASDDPERGNVIEVTFNDSDAFGVWFIGSGATDLRAYGSGAVQFDLKVLDYGNNTQGMTFKIDCTYPCSSGDKPLGFIADGVWETVTFPVALLLPPPGAPLTPLDLEKVSTGIVLFPTTQSGDIVFQIDDIRWIAETDALPLQQIDLPVTFDDPLVDYTVIDFGDQVSASTVLGEDPDNASNTVAITTKPTGAPVWAGTTIGNPDFANPIPFTDTDTQMSVRVYSPTAGIPVLLKVENVDNGDLSAEVSVNTTVANEWETLVFDFATPNAGALDPAVEYGKASIFFDFGTEGNDAVYYWDDVQFGAPPPADIELINPGFESGDFSGWTVGGGTNTVGAPGVGARTGEFAAQLTTPGGSTVDNIVPEIRQTFTANPGDEVNFSAWLLTEAALPDGPSFGLAKIVFFDIDGNLLVPASASIGVINTEFPGIESEPFLNSASPVNEWVFSEAQGVAPAGTAEVAFLLLNVDYAGGENPLWFDDALASNVGAQPPGAGEQIDLPVTFDDPLVDYTVIDFGDPPASTVLGEDPNDAGNTVAITTKPTGAPVWAGTTIGNPDFANPIPFTDTDTQMSVRVYSPTAGIPVLLKVENVDNGDLSAEVSVNTTVANEWETLVFDFATPNAGALDPAVEYGKASIFFDFGTEGNDAVYYWDDVQFGAPPPADIELSNPGFESGDFTGSPGWTVNAGDNTVGAPDGGARSGSFAAQLTTTGGGGTAEIRQTFAASPGDEVYFSAWMLTEAALPEGASFGLAKIVFFDIDGEELVPASASIGVINTQFPGIESEPFLNSASPVNTWVFSEAQGVAPAGTVEVAFLLLNVDFAGGENPIWFDDAVASTVGSGPPVILDPIDLPVTFDDPLVDYTLTDFGRAASVVGDDPTGADNMVAVTTKTAGSEVWAGTTIGTNAGFANPIPFTDTDTQMSVRVYSPTAGIPVLLKVENVDNGDLFAEVSVNTTVANDWETLVFDFATPTAGMLDPSVEYGKASIFFDFGTAGNDAVYYWDDVQFGAPPPVVLDPIDLPVTFDDPLVDYTVIDFGDLPASTVLGEDPDNAENTVAITTKPTGAPFWAGTTIGNPDFASPIPFTADATSMSVDVRVPVAGIPVLLKVETADCPSDGNDVTCFAQTDAFPTMADTWETLTWDFSLVGIDTTKTFVKASIFFDFGTEGNDAVYLWDNVRFGEDEPPPDGIGLINGGFETGDFTGWEGSGNNATGAPVAGARSGSFAAQLTTTGGGKVSEVRQAFAANPGDEVNLSVWMLTEAQLPAGASFGLAKIVFRDAGGADLIPESASIGVINFDFPGIESQPFVNDASAIDTWVFSEAQGVAPAGTVEVIFQLLNVDFAGGENPIWFDDAQATLIDNVLGNPGFETGDFTGWEGSGNNTTGAPVAGARSGSFAAQLTTTGGGKVSEVRQAFAANPGDEVNLSVWMLTEAQLPAGASFGLAKIVFRDAGGADLIPESASIGVINFDFPGIESQPFVNDASAIDTWVFSEAQGVAPAGTTEVIFQLLNVDFAGGENPIWFDDAQAIFVGAAP